MDNYCNIQREMSKNKSSKCRESYQEEIIKNIQMKNPNEKALIIVIGSQRFLEHFEEDIAEEISSEKGVKVIWKDGYIAVEDVTAD